MNQKQTQQTRPGYARPVFEAGRHTAGDDRISFGREVGSPRSGPAPPGWGAAVLRLGCGCAGLGSFAFLAGASAQTALGPPPLDFSDTNQAPQLSQSRLMDTSVLAPAPASQLGAQPVLQAGPVVFHPHLFYRFTYAEGLPAQAYEKVSTAINEVDPGIGFDLGKHWRLDYTPSLRYYSNHLLQDTTDHSVGLVGSTSYEDWTFGLSQRYATVSQPTFETGAQTDLETYSTALNATYSFNAKTSLEMGLNQDIQNVGPAAGPNASAQELVDSKVWSTMDWLNYQFWPKIGSAIGLGGGYVDLSAGSSMTFEEVQGRLTWQVARKLSLVVSAGYEEWQFLDVNTQDLVSPIFGASAVYRPFEGTALSVSAARSVMVSYIFNQVIENTSVSGGVHQQVFKKLAFDLTGGYGVASYEASDSGLSLSREDHNLFLNARLSMPFLKRANAGVFYQASKNTSGVSQFQISTTQVGFDLGYSF
ncbi:MAG: hypothetical protein ACLQVX_09505 [Limisphaerales bacterium]